MYTDERPKEFTFKAIELSEGERQEQEQKVLRSKDTSSHPPYSTKC